MSGHQKPTHQVHTQNGPDDMKGLHGAELSKAFRSFPLGQDCTGAVLASAQYIEYSANILLPQGISSFVNILSLQDQNTLHNLH